MKLLVTLSTLTSLGSSSSPRTELLWSVTESTGTNWQSRTCLSTWLTEFTVVCSCTVLGFTRWSTRPWSMPKTNTHSLLMCGKCSLFSWSTAASRTTHLWFNAFLRSTRILWKPLRTSWWTRSMSSQPMRRSCRRTTSSWREITLTYKTN